ncbi:DUF454 domain-containing protein [Wenzhouxiangella sp. XN79A]|uniref:YbaN family protein n=1 Tax=Wenzhouxiangella sp. XN79A TaxID=2724193 RepID=UPI00144A9135|nr:YbaN family protein [Wenzhouxiangella sp. XN79A]NKI35349.1 DUF454 domain-containing protein [Wenzhouxiangella sp. XN79A]
MPSAPGSRSIGLRSTVYRLLALVCLSAGTLGLLLPLLPTTPFVLLALWAASRGAPELAETLRDHPRHGPLLRGWEQHRAIPRRARILAVAMLAFSALTLWIGGIRGEVLIALLVLFAGIGTWVWTRPDPSERA